MTERQISIHALREEGDAPIRQSASLATNFYPRPPRGGRRLLKIEQKSQKRFLSTPSARRATKPLSPPRALAEISIHALREEGDSTRAHTRTRPADFYPRPPRGGRRAPVSTSSMYSRFLSTPSARRATP